MPAAACARGLAETAAQLHADAVKVAAGWDALKLAMTGEEALTSMSAMRCSGS